MKVRVLSNFQDLKENKDRVIGEEFDVSEERAKEIMKYNFVIPVTETKAEAPKKKAEVTAEVKKPSPVSPEKKAE